MDEIENLRQFKLSERKPLRILVSGSSGFIGKHLCAILKFFGDEVVSLGRRDLYGLDLMMLEGFDVVIHLAGENITGLWSKGKKRRIFDSRVNSTRWLARSLNQLKNPPKSLLCASACGFYGDRKNENLDETSLKGKGFLADTVEAWEKAAQEFTKGRVVSMRFGVVLGLEGGMLQKVLKPFKMGLGMTMGSGSEWMSWISIDDLIYQILHVLKNEHLQGPINFTTPYPVTSGEFSHTLAALCKRRVFFRFPRWLIKALLGEKGEALLLTSSKITPKVLLESGAVFSYPTLSEALKVYLNI